MSTSIIKYIFEVVLIVLGVFLGLFVNELRIEQRDLARAERALEQITAELQFNQKMITRISVHHVAVKDSLDALLSRTDFQENTVTLPELWKSMLGGFGVVGLQRQAWTLANRLGALEHMDYETASKLSRTYDLQEFYTAKYDRLADNFYLAPNVDPNNREGLVFALAMLANDIVVHEEDLSEVYVKILDHLGVTQSLRTEQQQ